jgi:L-ascorbate metabolism protein UlaG (beta-lactamase superfamily)
MASDHYDGRRFFNPGGANGRPVGDLPRLFLEMRRTRTPWPAHLADGSRVPPKPEPGQTVVTFLGHASFLIQSPDANILIDPVFSERASPVRWAGPRRARAPGCRLDDLPRVDLVLLSHNHYDHCDLRSLRRIARAHAPAAVTPVGNGGLLRDAGIKRVEELDWWDAAASTAFGVTCVPAQHFSARTPFDRNKALWSGFHLVLGGRTILFAGDSGYGPHYQAMQTRLGAPDLALLPIGAYEPRWFMKDIHMNPDEAVRAHRDLGSRRSIAMHYGTFQLTPEGIDEPVKALAIAMKEQDVAADAFIAIEPGISIVV